MDTVTLVPTPVPAFLVSHLLASLFLHNLEACKRNPFVTASLSARYLRPATPLRPPHPSIPNNDAQTPPQRHCLPRQSNPHRRPHHHTKIDFLLFIRRRPLVHARNIPCRRVDRHFKSRQGRPARAVVRGILLVVVDACTQVSRLACMVGYGPVSIEKNADYHKLLLNNRILFYQ